MVTQDGGRTAEHSGFALLSLRAALYAVPLTGVQGGVRVRGAGVLRVGAGKRGGSRPAGPGQA